MINGVTSPHAYTNHPHSHLSPIDATQIDPMNTMLHLHYGTGSSNHQSGSNSIMNSMSTSTSSMHPSSSLPQHSYSSEQMYTNISPLKRKISTASFSSSSSYVRTSPTSSHSHSHSDHLYSGSTTGSLLHGSSPRRQVCQICQYPDPILIAPKCGHTFHSRCVHAWPMEKCPVCEEQVHQVGVLQMDMTSQIESRSGKWTREEEKFVHFIVKEFDRQSFPLANGTPVRLVLAKLLNCSTMRLSKKFQKKALGKRTFRIPKGQDQMDKFLFEKHSHAMRQKEFSYYESMFRLEVEELHRREHSSDLTSKMEVQNIRLAVNQFWMINFLKFAIVIGQQVQGLDTSDAKKRKMALKKLRDGKVDELLGWNTTSPVHVSNLSPFMMNPHQQQQQQIPTIGGTGGHYDQLYLPQAHSTWEMATDSMVQQQPFHKKMKTSTEHLHQQQATNHIVPLDISCDVSPLPSHPQQQNRFHFQPPYHGRHTSTTATGTTHTSSYYQPQHQSSPQQQYSHGYHPTNYVSSHHSHDSTDLEPLHHAYGSDNTTENPSNTATSSSSSTYNRSVMSSEVAPCPLDQLLDDMSKHTSSHVTGVQHQGDHPHWSNSLPIV